MNVLLASRSAPSTSTPVRVMVVDDSVVVRGLVARWVDEEPGLHVVAALRTGREAVNQFERFDPDVVILDVEMPDLDGLSALPLLLAKKRDLVVIMASALSRRHAELSIKALSLGAADYVPKPGTNRDVTTSPAFRRELVEKVRQLGARQVARRAHAAGPHARLRRVAAPSIDMTAEKPVDIALRPFASVPPRVLLIGASTGGPQALGRLLPALGRALDRVPILIVQHMPPTFTTILAENLSRATGRPTHEAMDGQPIVAGVTYLAPGARHMRVERRNGRAVIAIDDSAPVNFCKPALDPLFVSASEIWGNSVLATVLTGMGCDGANGAEAIVAAGGSVVAQDEATSVVWGMPGTVAQAGLCAAVLPIDEIAAKITRVFVGDIS